MAKLTNPNANPALVLCHWLDAHSPDATTVISVDETDSVHRALPMITCGWLMRNDEYGVTIGSEYCGGGMYRGVTVIPRGMITKMEPIRIVRPRKSPPEVA